jgi:hypothetical protein
VVAATSHWGDPTGEPGRRETRSVLVHLVGPDDADIVPPNATW